MAQPLSRADLEAAISKYGPVLQVHPDEKYDLCSIEWFLSHCTLIDSQKKIHNIVHPTVDQLPQTPKQGTRYYLDIEKSAWSGDFSSELFRCVGCRNWQENFIFAEHHIIAGRAYVNAFWEQDLPYTDIQFWFFSAFNGPGTARFASLTMNKVDHTGDVDLSPLGEHVGDWEYAATRIDNASKEMIGIMLSQHGKNILYTKENILQEFKMVNGTHPVVYASKDGHANFPSPGPNFTEHHQVLGIPVGLDFHILNSTADGGKQLDCSVQYEIVSAKWLNETADAYPIPYWLGYPYRWGPEGTAITMDTKTLGAFITAALGNDAKPILGTLIVLLASELLHIFVRAE